MGTANHDELCSNLSPNENSAVAEPNQADVDKVSQPKTVSQWINQEEQKRLAFVKEIEISVNSEVGKWREDWHSEHPGLDPPIGHELEIRKLLFNLEALKRGVPTQPLIRPATLEETAAITWDVRGFQDAFSATERPPWTIQDLVLEKSITGVSAHPHGTKSLTWLQVCIEAITKKKVWGHFDAPYIKKSLFRIQAPTQT